jgi:hypothetical protein
MRLYYTIVIEERCTIQCQYEECPTCRCFSRATGQRTATNISFAIYTKEIAINNKNYFIVYLFITNHHQAPFAFPKVPEYIMDKRRDDRGPTALHPAMLDPQNNARV